jgi:hypothetical protein
MRRLFLRLCLCLAEGALDRAWTQKASARIDWLIAVLEN